MMKRTTTPDPAAFDLPVPGIEDRHLKMEDLLRAFRSATFRDPELALKMGREMVASRYMPGQLAYAQFLRTTTGVSMPRSQRNQAAENILRLLDLSPDLAPAMEAEISMELAELFMASRPVAALAALLRANRLGAVIPPDRIQRCKKAVLRSVDVNHLGDDPADAYALAVELDKLGNAPQFTEVFYTLAYEGAGQNTILKGKAALGLAGFYRSSDEAVAAKYYLVAQRCGFPDLVI